MSPTIKNVADLAGVSTFSVSMVLNEKYKGEVSEATRRKILQATRKLNYRPNPYGRGLRLQRSETIAYVLSLSYRSLFFDPYFYEEIFAMEKEVKKHNYSLLFFVFSSKKEEIRFWETFLQPPRIDGIILRPPSNKDVTLVNKLSKENYPVVAIGSHPAAKKMNYVDADNVGAAYKATEHLIKLGRKKICFITGPYGFGNTCDRLEGYKKALKENAINVKPELIKKGDYSIECGYKALKEITEAGYVPDGVVASNELSAGGAINLIKEKNLKIPEDIAVVGFNDTFFSRSCNPPLTTISIPVAGLVSKAVEMLVRILKKEPVEEKIILGTELIVRESTVKNKE